MIEPTVVTGIHVELRAEGQLVDGVLGALVDERALLSIEGCSRQIRLEEVLAKLRPQSLEQETHVRGDGIACR